jgi:hypothetical protein
VRNRSQIDEKKVAADTASYFNEILTGRQSK